MYVVWSGIDSKLAIYTLQLISTSNKSNTSPIASFEPASLTHTGGSMQSPIPLGVGWWCAQCRYIMIDAWAFRLHFDTGLIDGIMRNRIRPVSASLYRFAFFRRCGDGRNVHRLCPDIVSVFYKGWWWKILCFFVYFSQRVKSEKIGCITFWEKNCNNFLYII